jgi:hypothetical protein
MGILLWQYLQKVVLYSISYKLKGPVSPAVLWILMRIQWICNNLTSWTRSRKFDPAPDPDPFQFIMIQRNLRKKVKYCIIFNGLLRILLHILFNGHKNVKVVSGSVIIWPSESGYVIQRIRIHNTAHQNTSQ